MADGAAESTKELTEEGAKVVTVAEGTDATAAPPAEPANPLAEPIFVSVVHTFVDDEKKAAWWAKMGPLMGDKAQMAALAASWKALGYVGHYSLPCGPEGAKINCLWECRTEDAAAKFQDFIDNDATSPASGGTFTNDCYRAMPGALVPATGFTDTEPAEPKKTSGAFFWVLHTFKPDGAAGFWAKVGPALGDPAKFAAMVAGHKEAGFYNHSFIATKAGGSDPMVCVWESKNDCTTEEFQAFIDDNDVAPGDAFLDNAVFKIAPGAQVPSAMFPAE
jgi:hypothetical protein